MLEKGKRIPNWHITDVDGNAHDVWDFRQKSHVILLYDPQADAVTVGHWQKAIKADRKQWDWLNAKILIVTDAPKEMASGAYVIDRYGMLWNYFAPDAWTFEDLDRDLMYYEARHC